MKTLAELKEAGLLACTLKDVLDATVKAAVPDEERSEAEQQMRMLVEAGDEYLKIFLVPTKDFECIKCGSKQGGLLGNFRWGLVHGEGLCTTCHYPARGYHKIEYDGDQWISLDIILQYHPSRLSEKEKEHDEEVRSEDLVG